MANFIIPDEPAFSDTVRKVETTDPVHADIVNPVFEALLLNSVYLYKRCKNLETELEKAKTGITYGGNELSSDANIEDDKAQYPVIQKTLSNEVQELFHMTRKLPQGIYAIMLRAKVSDNTPTESIISIKAKTNNDSGTLIKEVQIKPNMFIENNKFQTVGFLLDFDVNKNDELFISASLLAGTSAVTVSIDYILLSPAYTAVSSMT